VKHFKKFPFPLKPLKGVISSSKLRQERKSFEERCKQQYNKKFTPEEYLELIRRELNRISIERNAARDITEISFPQEKEHWNKKISSFKENERFLRRLAVYYKSKAKNKRKR
jgi:hypothetical protein